MNLLVDSGNTFIKWQLLAGDAASKVAGKCLTEDVLTLARHWENIAAPDRVVISNVSGKKIGSELCLSVAELWGLEVEFVSSESNCCGLVNSYHQPEQLGVDRWMAMVGAYSIKHRLTVVIDCGTAVTVDLITEDGVFLGGVILPGLKTALNSLVNETNAVEEKTETEIKWEGNVAALSTAGGVQAGVMFGLAGGIERVVAELVSKVDSNPEIYITGGDAEKILPYLSLDVILQSDLVIQGLSIFARQDWKYIETKSEIDLLR